jgi:UDP-N-acetylmuramoyl-L-alanyl-D-glutamate--2,6-diaminopimelate ligase
VEIDGAQAHFYLPVKGRFNIYNCLGAIGAALALGLPLEKIREGVAAIKGIPGRIQAVPNKIGAHIFVDYAHTPDSLVNIINSVREITAGKLVLLFGCGGDKDTLKRPKMGRIAGELADHSILTSDNPRSEPPEEIIRQIEEGVKETHSPYDIFVNRRDAIFAGIKMLNEGDALIIAGKGHENYQIIGNEKIHFDDMEVALQALGEIR